MILTSKTKNSNLADEAVAEVAKLLRAFLSTAPAGIGRAQDLALTLAIRSELLRDYLGEELARQESVHKEGRLYGLFQIFRDQVFQQGPTGTRVSVCAATSPAFTIVRFV